MHLSMLKITARAVGHSVALHGKYYEEIMLKAH